MSELSTALKDLSSGDILCSFAHLRNSLHEEDLEALDLVITKGFPSYAIAKILRDAGFKMSHGSIQDHRDAKCKCFKVKK